MRPRPLLSLAGLACLALAALPAASQQPQPDPARPLLAQIVPHPTGRNGYEELLMAVDALNQSRLFRQVDGQPGVPLATKRLVLADRNVDRALALLRRALQKPVLQPREVINLETVLPEFARFRALARSLALQEYVLLADGRVTDALAAMRLGIRFSEAIQLDTLIGGLVGLACAAVVIQPVAHHLDQLSARDCETLFRICEEWLSYPNPYIRVMEGERRLVARSLVDVRERAKQAGPAAAAGLLGVTEDEVRTFRDRLPRTPEAIDALFAEALRRFDLHTRRILEELNKEPWERRLPEVEPPAAATDLAGYVVALVAPAYRRVDEAYSRQVARVRLLACHAAIGGYRWEFDTLPPNLGVLNLGRLAVDPFNGQPLQYRAAGARYTLASIGAPAGSPDDPRAVEGRIPVSLTPD